MSRSGTCLVARNSIFGVEAWTVAGNVRGRVNAIHAEGKIRRSSASPPSIASRVVSSKAPNASLALVTPLEIELDVATFGLAVDRICFPKVLSDLPCICSELGSKLYGANFSFPLVVDVPRSFSRLVKQLYVRWEWKCCQEVCKIVHEIP